MSKELYTKYLKKDSENIYLNKKLCLKVGLSTAFYLAILISLEQNKKEEVKNNNGYFKCPQKDIQEITKLSFYKQAKMVKVLVNKKLILVERKGIPPIQYFKINYNRLIA